eukprot:3975900-Heterocapsa_arctica.AAC.1
MCNAFLPGVVSRLIVERAVELGVDPADLVSIESGGEDMPDAFRTIPIAPQDLDVNVIAIENPDTGVWHYQVVWAALFGFASAVVSFARWSAFLQAAGRRIAMLAFSMYSDDGLLLDSAIAKGAGQQLLHVLFECIGAPLSVEKRTAMATVAQFLGIQHDLTEALTAYLVRFWAREGLDTKVGDVIEERLSTGRTTPAEASKLRGILSFTLQAAWGRVGRAALGPLRQRQYTDRPPWSNSHALNASFAFLRELTDMRPRREVFLRPVRDHAIVIASDAQADGAPTGGFLCVDTGTGERFGGYCAFDEEILAAFGFTREALGDGANPIQDCEAAMVPITLCTALRKFAGRELLWFLDNTSALHAFVKGSGGSSGVERS